MKNEKTRYPFQDNWPIEGFAMDESKFVQIRFKSVSRAKPPCKGYPPVNGTTSTYRWYEVWLCFRPYTPEESTDGPYIEIKSKLGRSLKNQNIKQCIARFKTESEARLFVHKMHQSKLKRVFFNDSIE